MNKENDEVAVRLDKWMWASRFCKTRSLARTLIQSGRSHTMANHANLERSLS